MSRRAAEDPAGAKVQDPTADVVVDRYRRASVVLVAISILLSAVIVVVEKVRLDPTDTGVRAWVIAALLVVSRRWWSGGRNPRLADLFGTLALISLAGASCGALAMLGLRLHLPMADNLFRNADLSIGLDSIAIVGWLLRQGQWIFTMMAPAYAYTIPLVALTIGVLALIGDRIEAWRTALCFIGSLLTICVIAPFLPAKGVGMWMPDALLAHLPDGSMRYFWTQFDLFYAGPDPVLQVSAIDGVISFPSFHAAMGFIIVAAWRKHLAVAAVAVGWLAFMLLATLAYGGHYIVDLVGGFIVWLAWFMVSRGIQRRPRANLHDAGR